MNDTLKYVSFKRVVEVPNMFFHLANAVMNSFETCVHVVETCVGVVETSVHVKVHSPDGFLQCLESTQILW